MTRVVGGLLAFGMVLFALFGGDYGTHHLLAMNRQVRDERARISALRHEVDSLARVLHGLKTDPATQERVARELYGMIRPGEVLYQVVPKDSAER
ncbi:MAG: septum formation initiator family protein [Gemmatimonadales bacterium]